MRKLILLVLTFLVANVGLVASAKNIDDIHWEDWSDSVFKKAKSENRFVILDLEAIWCHWCHVMHKETYSDPSIRRLIKSHFIPVRVDQDSRPDLSNRYREYGWPATIVFNSNGEEIIKRSGYIPPDEMKIELQNIVDDPTPEEDIDESNIRYSINPFLSDELRKDLINRHKSSYDAELGGLKLFQKYIDRDSVEYSLVNAKDRDLTEKEMARKTLNAGIMLIDPVWGGVYQYSTMGGWDYPHFEKLAGLQGEYMHIYAYGYETLHDSTYLKAVKDIYHYIKTFLKSPGGVFYTSQDADLVQGEHSREYFALSDNERRKSGIPRIDKHVYSNQNGLIIYGLVALYEVTKERKYLNEAIDAANWLIKYRSIKCSISETFKWIFSDWTSLESVLSNFNWILTHIAFPQLGFRHDNKDIAGPYLSDTLNMGRAFLGLYKDTNDRKWLTKAEQATNFINQNFLAPVAGFSTSKLSCLTCAVRNPDRLLDENINLARFANQLFIKTKNKTYKEIAEHAMRYITTPEIAKKNITEPGILLAELELAKSRKEL